MTTVPFLDLKAENQSIQKAIQAAIGGVLQRADFILGSAVQEFETAFARYCGSRFCIGVNSGLDALTLALQASGIGPGDEVITAANTFIATACSITRTGAQVVLVDCDNEDLALDPKLVEAAITPRTRAIVPVHLFGKLVHWQPLQEIADRHGLQLFEDAAQAHGAMRHGRRAGSLGKAASFSFYPSKNLGAFGDGGAVTTDDENLAEYVRYVRTYGQKVKNRHDWAGTNSRLDTLQAAVLLAKLLHLDAHNAMRRQAAALYRQLLADLSVELVASPDGEADHVYHLFVIRIADRDRVRAGLQEHDIETGIHYPTPIHLQPAYRHLGKGRGSYPVAEGAADEMLSLPMFPYIRPEQIEQVVRVLDQLLVQSKSRMFAGTEVGIEATEVRP
jgi:dTDP-4-amino-4,6-dideoxygalactose transaminase